MDLPAATKRIEELERENARLKKAAVASTGPAPTGLTQIAADLRLEGLRKGSTGVLGAFILYGCVFAAAATYEWIHGKQLATAPDMILLGVVLCGALLVYFGFIFGFTLAAEWSAEKARFATGNSAAAAPDATPPSATPAVTQKT